MLIDPATWNVLLETVSFAVKGVVVFLTIATSAAVIFALAQRGKRTGPRLQIKSLNEHYERMADALRRHVMHARDYKRFRKQRAKELKAKDKALGKRQPEGAPAAPSPRTVYVLDFHGDIMAHAVENLREEISGIIGSAAEGDEVVLRIESPGGVVHGYGLAASQLLRLKQKGIRLVACVDKVAASGGYMMACVADEILAAPFAVLGSIGVAAALPNIHRLLDRHGVDYEDVTAGEYKRTVTFLGEITEKGRAKFQEQIDDTHQLFKAWVKEHRPDLDIDATGTGEHWYGQRALELGLANRLTTSDDYLMSLCDEAHLYEVTCKRHRTLRDRVGSTASDVVEAVVDRLWTRWATAIRG